MFKPYYINISERLKQINHGQTHIVPWSTDTLCKNKIHQAQYYTIGLISIQTQT